MLQSLAIENFYSFKTKQTIDLRSRDGSAANVISLFGANGSGKSNVLKALSFVTWLIRDSFVAAPDAGFLYMYFVDGEGIGKETKFTLRFSVPTAPGDAATTQYRYEVSLTNFPGERIRTEGLWHRPSGAKRESRLFMRRGEQTDATSAFGLGPFKDFIGSALRRNASLISTLAQVKHPIATSIWAQLGLVFANITSLAKLDQSDAEAIDQYRDDVSLVEAFNRDLRRLDVGLESVAIVRRSDDTTTAQFHHNGLQTTIPFGLESHGTKHFFRIFPLIEKALRTGGVAIIDEIDASVHPLLLPEIVEWFRNTKRNRYGAQLWMSCQSAPLLEYLNREEIFFCEKGIGGASSVYGLNEIAGVRRTDSFFRKYIGGVYGAVPRVG